ncbi:MAG: hypothetical protein GC159_22910 [Phycisphaera sp.]|nr:hypothetical protein [Phycisphaera sp.]
MVSRAPAAKPVPSTPAVPDAAPPVETDITHGFLATGGETYILDTHGKEVWRYNGATRDGWVLDSGNVLLAVNPGKGFPGGGIVEVTREGEVLWSWKGLQKETQAVEPLANGHVLAVEGGNSPRLVELERDGSGAKVALEFPLQCQTDNTHMETRMARKLPNGNYLVPHLLDFAVKEYDPKGNVVKVLRTDLNGREVHDWPFTAIRLDNGNTLIGCTHGNKVIELDPDGRLVWQVTNEDLGGNYIKDACGVQRLPNGNTVITAYASHGKAVKLIEVTREKKIVWTWSDDKGHGIHDFQILDTNGKKLTDATMK